MKKLTRVLTFETGECATLQEVAEAAMHRVQAYRQTTGLELLAEVRFHGRTLRVDRYSDLDSIERQALMQDPYSFTEHILWDAACRYADARTGGPRTSEQWLFCRQDYLAGANGEVSVVTPLTAERPDDKQD